MFPRTHYFEVDSVLAGARYAVWVTLPIGYEHEPERRFATIYSPDGNRNVAFAAGLSDLSAWDLMDRFEPTIQVCVGYTDEDAGRALAVRARDLLPPREELPKGMIEKMRESTDTGPVLDREGIELYIHNLQNPAGDRFLAFLCEELHPFIATNYRVAPDSLGLFGHSYGGLFAAYAALQPSTPFRNFCASSPGILIEHSVIFKLYAEALERGGLPSSRHMHMTAASRELTDPGLYLSMVGGGTVEFLRLAGMRPMTGLSVSSRLFEDETHITVKPTAMHSFLRQCYLSKPQAAT
ncbi:alpha/beta hydrolase [Pelomonas sp. KK5]|uniref:alpha/beta hydrolase n=1 Tax=Pelomonas sp. KK5 TaxID=1855730 RepID=UPI00097C6650|nr:alpha/beta hydrolase-fold protein [Pelomonas sp. KK5]